jgi:glutaredoxin
MESHAHPAHKAENKVRVKTSTLWQAVAGVLAVVLVVSILTGGFAFKKAGAISADEAATNAIDFINTRLELAGANVTATLDGVVEKNGLYAVTLSIEGQQMESYVTKDGQLLFPQAIPMVEETAADLSDTTADTSDTSADTTAQAAAYPTSEVPNFKMFVMSFCPYGQQAEAAVQPVAELFGDKIAFEPHFVVSKDSSGNYVSLHGAKELNEDVRQMCIWKNYQAKWWDYVSAINENCALNDIDSCWSSIAQQKGIDVAKIEACAADEADTLLAAELALNQEFAVRGSPTMFVNDETYAGGRTAEAIKAGVCAAFAASPAECGETLSSTAAATTGGCA